LSAWPPKISSPFPPAWTVSLPSPLSVPLGSWLGSLPSCVLKVTSCDGCAGLPLSWYSRLMSVVTSDLLALPAKIRLWPPALAGGVPNSSLASAVGVVTVAVLAGLVAGVALVAGLVALATKAGSVPP
jgi:hypothetical protein